MTIKITQPISVANSDNLTVGSEHKTVECPAEHSRYKNDIWVQGEKEPVRLFPREYDIIDTSDLDHPAYQIMVEVVNTESLSNEVNKQLQENEQFKGNDYELKENIALVKSKSGKIIMTDSEACFYDNFDTPVKIDIYRKSIKEKDEDGNGVTKVFMFPACQGEFTYDNLKSHVSNKTNLAEFMGDRFQYNPRLIDNLNNLMQHINK